MQKNVVISILSIILLVLVLATIGFGCSFKMENFEDIEDVEEDFTDDESQSKPEAEKKTESSALTPKEKEMFENIKNGSLTDEDIQKFIAEGKLTEKMVEKFLEHVGDAPALGAKAAAPAKVATPSPTKKPAVEEEFDVEGFSGSMYAQY